MLFQLVNFREAKFLNLDTEIFYKIINGKMASDEDISFERHITQQLDILKTNLVTEVTKHSKVRVYKKENQPEPMDVLDDKKPVLEDKEVKAIVASFLANFIQSLIYSVMNSKHNRTTKNYYIQILIKNPLYKISSKQHIWKFPDETIFSTLCKHGALPNIKLFLQKMADLPKDIRKILFKEAFEATCQQDRTDVLDLLISNARENLDRGDIENILTQSDSNSHTPLNTACKFNNLRSVKFLLDQANQIHPKVVKELIERKDEEGVSPLNRACINNCQQIVEEILRAADTVFKDDERAYVKFLTEDWDNNKKAPSDNAAPAVRALIMKKIASLLDAVSEKNRQEALRREGHGDVRGALGSRRDKPPIYRLFDPRRVTPTQPPIPEATDHGPKEPPVARPSAFSRLGTTTGHAGMPGVNERDGNPPTKRGRHDDYQWKRP